MKFLIVTALILGAFWLGRLSSNRNKQQRREEFPRVTEDSDTPIIDIEPE